MMVNMKKKLTVLIFDATGTPVKQVAIPRRWFPMSLFFSMSVAIVLYFGISDYLRLKTENTSLPSLAGRF